MTTMIITLHADDFFAFRRWLKARDPGAAVTTEPIEDDLWRVRAQTAKFYLSRMAARRWAARQPTASTA